MNIIRVIPGQKREALKCSAWTFLESTVYIIASARADSTNRMKKHFIRSKNVVIVMGHACMLCKTRKLIFADSIS
jgi:hypothetical protein